MRIGGIVVSSLAVVVALLVVLLPLGPVERASGQQSHQMTKQMVDQWMEDLSNWGRWGADDELGTINLITPAKRLAAAKLVRAGVSVSLSHNVNKVKSAENSSPFEHKMVMTGLTTPGQFCVDTYAVLYHGYAHSHLDAICHMFYKGKMYNGYSQKEVTDAGAQKLSVLNMKNGIFTRGVLMDIPKLKGLDYLKAGTPIYPEDLDAWEKKAGLKVGSGDVVFIRTGRSAQAAKEGPLGPEKLAGLHASCTKWLKDRDVAILGSDGASDVRPSLVEGVDQPVHQLVLIAMGMPIFDVMNLEDVSKEAERQGRWEFLLTAAPLAVEGGTGSPLNPIATF
ncbi:MAG: cyclase family protein [Acidobacteria bacterium]|nr:cyclase family protein [Acidobacteriota bacterium]